MLFRLTLLIFFLTWSFPLVCQPFYYGADLSYVNEMEDCGVVYKENEEAKDPYVLFADNGHNLVRLRLWHTPVFYDTLNAGKRYSDLPDVRRSIRRAKDAGMEVLLDFHLSDFWADPGRQLVPVAWEPVVNNLPVLQDSLYNYIVATLSSLDREGLLPEMVQVGNETNKGILLSPAQNEQGWVLNWPRNAALFNTAIRGVREVERQSNKKIRVALHTANPADTKWLIDGFWQNGVRDFDLIGISYYWAWHQPVSIAQTGQVIRALKQDYPGKEVMVFETGYPWTLDWHDSAGNIITALHPDYSPASPANQKKWLEDLTQTVAANGGSGVIYWEPAWQSSPCRTPWGQGSHQEHATYFDFSNNALSGGGLYWPQKQVVAAEEAIPGEKMTGSRAFLLLPGRALPIFVKADWRTQKNGLAVTLTSIEGKAVLSWNFGKVAGGRPVTLHINSDLPAGQYVLTVYAGEKRVEVQRVVVGN